MNAAISKIQNSKLLKEGYFSFLIALLSLFVLPIYAYFLPPLMAIWCISWILEQCSQGNLIWNNNKRYKVLFILFILLYLLDVVSLIYTSDIKMGILNLFSRLSLVVFPLVLFSPGDMIISKIKLLLKIFATGTFLFMVFCFGYALYRSVSLNNGNFVFNTHPAEYPWLSYFYSSDLTLSQHPSYISMYVLLSVFICFETWFEYSVKSMRRFCWLVLGLMLLICQYFLSSRAGILASLVLVPVYLIIRFRKSAKFKYSWIWIVLIIVALSLVIVKNQRVDYLIGRVINKHDFDRKQDPRFLIWKASVEIARNNGLLGVGIGDVRTELAKQFEKHGEKDMAKERLNAHNQFIEILLENGLIGLVLFLVLFGYMIFIAFSEKNLIYGLFILMMFNFFMFETVLYRLSGITFFSLFSFLLLHVKSKAQIIE